jgi:transposase
MRYLGMDVHSKASVWCLLDQKGEEVGRGKTATVREALQRLVASMAAEDALVVGQEVGTMGHYVHDAVTDAGVRILSFNAQHLRMISSSRKKTDRRDAYWIAKALQTGMMPHPVYIPRERERRLRAILSMREGVKDSPLTTRLHRSPQPGEHEGARPRNSMACQDQAVR